MPIVIYQADVTNDTMTPINITWDLKKHLLKIGITIINLLSALNNKKIPQSCHNTVARFVKKLSQYSQ